ncbi:MAG: hypothetical protein IT536_14225 [Hyphomicrobiales bacterium]|nr:hypothetical protein [Hyphomicrobiales bacterium]
MKYAAVIWMLAATPAFGQVVIDMSAKHIPPADWKEVARILAGQLVDVTDAQVRGLRKSSATHGYCGEVKARGAYADWSPFHVNIFTNTAWILTKAASREAYEDVKMRVFAFGCRPNR